MPKQISETLGKVASAEDFVKRAKQFYNVNLKIPRRKAKFESVLKGEACLFCLQAEDCPERYGNSIQHKSSKVPIRVHYFCLLFASGIMQRTKDSDCDLPQTKNAIHGFLIEDIVKEFDRGLKLKCNYCLVGGANIGCTMEKCRVSFHYHCGVKHHALYQFFGNFKSYCKTHKPIQQVPTICTSISSDQNDNKSMQDTQKSCCICLEEVTPSDNSTPVLFSTCCRNTWFHRQCVQQQALSFGSYYFRCPACNDKEKYTQEMLRMGIYIPERDASWETPEAFADLLNQNMQCDVTNCLCKHGRNHDMPRTVWTIVSCKLCGLLGSHVKCSALKSLSSSYVCEICDVVNDLSAVSKNLRSVDTKEEIFHHNNEGDAVKCLGDKILNKQTSPRLTRQKLKRKRLSKREDLSKENGECSHSSRKKRKRENV